MCFKIFAQMLVDVIGHGLPWSCNDFAYIVCKDEAETSDEQKIWNIMICSHSWFADKELARHCVCQSADLTADHRMIIAGSVRRLWWPGDNHSSRQQVQNMQGQAHNKGMYS